MSEVSISLIYFEIELYLHVDIIFLLGINNEVNARNNHKRKENCKDDIEVAF